MLSVQILGRMLQMTWPLILAVACLGFGFYWGEVKVASIACEAGKGEWYIGSYGFTRFRFYGDVRQ